MGAVDAPMGSKKKSIAVSVPAVGMKNGKKGSPRGRRAAPAGPSLLDDEANAVVNNLIETSGVYWKDAAHPIEDKGGGWVDARGRGIYWHGQEAHTAHRALQQAVEKQRRKAMATTRKIKKP